MMDLQKEEIDKAFETMTDKQKNVAYAKWGENLGEPIKATTKKNNTSCNVKLVLM